VVALNWDGLDVSMWWSSSRRTPHPNIASCLQDLLRALATTSIHIKYFALVPVLYLYYSVLAYYSQLFAWQLLASELLTLVGTLVLDTGLLDEVNLELYQEVPRQLEHGSRATLAITS
jgi:hypothetical protein